jgi:hypothetical protein
VADFYAARDTTIGGAPLDGFVTALHNLPGIERTKTALVVEALAQSLQQISLDTRI